jgi:PAS domain S-box-containing protein
MINPKPKGVTPKMHLTETELQNNILEELPIGICRSDLKGTVKYVNKYFEEKTGYSRAEIIGRNVLKLDLFPDDMRGFILKRIAARIGGAPSEKWDTRFKCKDGTWIWVSLEATIIRKSGIPVGFQIAASDITERKRAEERLKESEERLLILFDYAPDAYYISDLKGNFLDGNKAAEKLLGYNRNELIGKSFLKLKILHPEQIKKAVTLLAKNIMRKSTGPDEFILNRKNGSQVTVEIRTHVVKIQNKTMVLGIAHDITERKQMEEALRESEAKYRAIYAASPNLIYLTDMDGNLLDANAALLGRVGLSLEQLRLMNVRDFYAEQQGDVLADIQARLKSGEIVIGFEINARAPGDEEYTYEIHAVPLKAHGVANRIVSVARDITERKQAEEKIKESEVKYRLIVENSRDAIVISQNDQYIYINDAFATMLGYQKEELLMSNYQKVYTEKAVEILKERTKQRSNGEIVPDRYETVFRKKDGAEVPVEANVRIIDYKGQKATFAFIRDITKQKEILAMLQASAGQSKGLKNLISICAGCNKIRDDEQEGHPWVSPPQYISERLPNVHFSHGMCPDCMKKWYPDYEAEKEANDKEEKNT